MKYFLITFAVWFLAAWFPQFVISWIGKIRFRRAKRKAQKDDMWIYKI